MAKTIRKLQDPILLEKKKLRVAAYARVSSGKDAMLHSLSAQVSYYSELIQNRREWEFVGIYTDEAITGTKDNRPEFQRLLADCRTGLIDLVITKSISRFARNTLTLLETTRELKTLGIDVFFEEQNIKTNSGEGEMILTLLASVAQEESRTTSENCKWRVRNGFKIGKPHNVTMLGYRYRNKELVVIPEEAKIVQMIYNSYLEGLGKDAIVNKLRDAGVVGRFGNPWCTSAVDRVLRNEAYTGSLLLQKTFRDHHITKRRCTNVGQLPMYFAEASHETIIDRDTFDRAQTELKRRATIYKSKPEPAQPNEGLFSGMINCGICGKPYHRRNTNQGKYSKVVWVCPTFRRFGKTSCPSKQIPEDILMSLTAQTLGIATFDYTVFKEQIKMITVLTEHKISFMFQDGHEVITTWQNQSRKESWTEEMRQRARDQETERRKT